MKFNCIRVWKKNEYRVNWSSICAKQIMHFCIHMLYIQARVMWYERWNTYNLLWVYQCLYIFVRVCMCTWCEKQFVLRFFFACWVWQMESGSKWHSYKATPGGDGLVTATSVAIMTECVCVHRCACVSYGQQKCWHAVASVCDGANLNSLWDAPKKQENTSAWRCKRRKKIQTAVEIFAVWTAKFSSLKVFISLYFCLCVHRNSRHCIKLLYVTGMQLNKSSQMYLDIVQ